MGLTMKERKAVTAVLRARYRRASKKQKGHLLDELIALTGYNRWYAVGLLRSHGPAPGGRRVEARARRRARRYDAAVLPEMIAVLERHGELQLDPGTRQKLCAISAASIDRLLVGSGGG